MTQMALVIDLNVCVGCHACVTSCKEWNTSGEAGSLTDIRPYDDPSGTLHALRECAHTGLDLIQGDG